MDKGNHQSQIKASFFYKTYNPFVQAGVILALMLVLLVLSKLVAAIGLLDVKASFPWSIACTLMLLYALFNSVFSLAAKNIDTYWTRSVVSYVALAVISGGLAYLFSSISSEEISAYRIIFIVVSIAYLVFLSIVRAMKTIVEFAQKEEWDKPKRRKRK